MEKEEKELNFFERIVKRFVDKKKKELKG